MTGALRARVAPCAPARRTQATLTANLSARGGDAMFITPSGIPAQVLKHGMIARMSRDCGDGHREGRLNHSAGWRVSRDLLRARPEFGAVVHTQAPFTAIPATARKPVPAIHCMMAAFGGPKMQVADCACYCIAAVVTAMKGRIAA